jgi:hypothetical protein
MVWQSGLYDHAIVLVSLHKGDDKVVFIIFRSHFMFCSLNCFKKQSCLKYSCEAVLYPIYKSIVEPRAVDYV